jgi:RNA polymerase sigma factor (sigma-70 family)
MHDEEDIRWVTAFQNGNEQAFDQIYEKYHVAVYSICYRYTRNEADALELTQDVFIKVYRNLARFRMESRFFTWLYRIAVNTCISFTRREHRLERLPTSESATQSLGHRMRLKVAIDDALTKLPDRQRLVFILHHYEGYTFEEIGEIMEITVGAAKANHHHAVKKLRLLLRKWL